MPDEEKKLKEDENPEDKQSSEQNADNKQPDVSGGETSQEDEQEKESDAKTMKAVKKGAGGAASKQGHSIGSVFLNMFMSGGAQMAGTVAAGGLLAAIKGFFGGIATGVKSFFTGAVAFFSNAAAGVATAFGMTMTMATISMVGGLIGGVVFGSAAIVMVVSNPADDAMVDPCKDYYIIQQQAVQEEAANQSQQMIENGKKCYSVFKAVGLSNENIAGILGNWQAESNIDSTSVETIFDEPYRIGPRKQHAQDVGFDIMSIDSRYGATYPLIKLAGIGLGGWTDTNDGATNNSRLRAFADSFGYEWWTLDIQLAFCLTPTAQGGDYGRFDLLNWEQESSPSSAALTFARYWEGNTSLAQAERQQYAEQWFLRIAEYDVDQTYADSILSMAQTASVDASGNSFRTSLEDCGGSVNNALNGSIAQAAVSYAYQDWTEGIGNNGTDLYQEVHDAIFPGDPWYQSCDRGVACAVRWSGLDDDFPAGAVSSQLNHMETSDKWKEILWDGDKSKLLPGDVLIRSDAAVGHVVLYVGNELIKAKWGEGTDPNLCVVSASYNERSPGCEGWYTGSTGLNTYRAFRCTNTTRSDRYIGVAGGSQVVVDDGGTTDVQVPDAAKPTPAPEVTAIPTPSVSPSAGSPTPRPTSRPVTNPNDPSSWDVESRPGPGHTISPSPSPSVSPSPSANVSNNP